VVLFDLCSRSQPRHKVMRAPGHYVREINRR
jgi:hypothetical protein